jgi:hypothetical protein
MEQAGGGGTVIVRQQGGDAYALKVTFWCCFIGFAVFAGPEKRLPIFFYKSMDSQSDVAKLKHVREGNAR